MWTKINNAEFNIAIGEFDSAGACEVLFSWQLRFIFDIKNSRHHRDDGEIIFHETSLRYKENYITKAIVDIISSPTDKFTLNSFFGCCKEINMNYVERSKCLNLSFDIQPLAPVTN